MKMIIERNKNEYFQEYVKLQGMDTYVKFVDNINVISVAVGMLFVVSNSIF